MKSSSAKSKKSNIQPKKRGIPPLFTWVSNLGHFDALKRYHAKFTLPKILIYVNKMENFNYTPLDNWGKMIYNRTIKSKGRDELVSIYNPKCRFLLLDVETTKEGGHLFDVSFSVYSRKEGIKGVAGYIISEYEKYIPWYADRVQRYKQYIREGKYEVRPFAEVMAILEKIIAKYEVAHLTAYNSGFDLGKIQQACSILKVKNPLTSLIELDLWAMACQTLGKQKYFQKFVKENNLITEVGNIRTNAETMYRYLISDSEFQEEHTGRADLLIEIEILERVLRQKKKMTTQRNNQAWRLVQG